MSVSGSKLGPAAKDAEGERTNPPSQSTPPDHHRHHHHHYPHHHHTHSMDVENKTSDRRRDHKSTKDNRGLSPSPKKTSRSSSTPAIYGFPPPKVPPPGGVPALSIEAPMSPTFSTAPTIGSPSTNFRSGRHSPFPASSAGMSTPTPMAAATPLTGNTGIGAAAPGVGSSPIRGIVDHPPLGPAPRKSSVVSLLNTEAGPPEHLVIHYPAKRASSPLAQNLTLPADRFGNSPDEYDSSDREDDDDDDEVKTMTSGTGTGSSIGSGQHPPLVEGLPKSSSTNSTGGERPLSAGAGSPGLSSFSHRQSPSLGARSMPGGGPPPPLNLTPGTRISLQFHTSTSSASASSPSPTPPHASTLPPFPPPLPPSSRPPPLPVTPPPPLPPVAFRSLPSSPRSPVHQLSQPRSSFSTATTILESPDTGQPPPSPNSTSWNQRSLSFSSTSHPPTVAPSSSLSKPLPPTPLTNLKRSMSLDSQKELLVRRGSHRQLSQTPLLPAELCTSSTSSPSSSSSSTSSTPATSAINSPSNSSTASSSHSPLPGGTPSHTPPPGILMSAEIVPSSSFPHSQSGGSMQTYSPSLSPAPSPSPSPRTLDVNIPASPIPSSKSMGSMTSPAHIQGSSPSIHSINRFKPRSMSQPWMLPPSSPGVYNSSSSSSEPMDGTPSSVLSSSSASSTSTSTGAGSPGAFTPPPIFTTSLSHSDLINAKFKNRFHSSFDDTPPMLSSGGTNLTEIQEVPEEEEREREKEKLILEKEMEISHSGGGGTNSRRSSVGAATTRPPSPSSRSNSSPTVSITKEVLMSRSVSSSAGSVNYSLSSLHPHALLWGQREATSFFNRPKEWKCARCKIKYSPLEHSWHCLPDKFFLCNICFNATQVTSE